LKKTGYFNIERVVIGVLILVIAILVAYSAIALRRSYILGQELSAAEAFIHEMQLEHEALRAETYDEFIDEYIDESLVESYGELFGESLEESLDEPFEEPHAEAPADSIYYLVIQSVLDIAPERLRQVFDEEVELNAAEGFVMLPDNRILISGQWFCAFTEMPFTIEAIFMFWLQDDEVSLSLLSYSPFGWANWRDPWESPNSHSWVRYHVLETVPVRFYGMGGDWDDIWYSVEYLNGESFAEELAYHALKHLNRIIIDAWFVGRILYVNLHHAESTRMSGGTFGEMAMYSTLVSSMASVPGIDALVIMVDGQREATFGGHGAAFSDIYLICTFNSLPHDVELSDE